MNKKNYVNICSYTHVAALRKEISDETDRETGRSKQISSVPIHLSIYSPNGQMNVCLWQKKLIFKQLLLLLL